MIISHAIDRLKKLKREHGDIELPTDPLALAALEGGGRMMSFTIDPKKWAEWELEMRTLEPGCGTDMGSDNPQGATVRCGGRITFLGGASMRVFCPDCRKTLKRT